MKKNYIQPKAICLAVETETQMLAGSPLLNNEEGNGIQRAKDFGEFEDTMEDDDFEDDFE